MEEVNYPEGSIRVLDHGFVKLVDSMGTDESIVQAARVSYGKGTKTVNEDRGLIRYLMRHRHTTPFEMVEFKFLIRMPIFVMRQWIRHRTASVNEYSGRYSEMPDLFYVPEVDQITKQSSSNKQGGADELVEFPEICQESFRNSSQADHENYRDLLDTGMRKELARINLPLSQYTECYWKIDLHNLFHFLKLRLDKHAQYEIRVFAIAVSQFVKHKVPIAYEAFEDYVLNSVTFSCKEKSLLRLAINKKELEFSDELIEDTLGNKRELEEFKEKLSKLRK